MSASTEGGAVASLQLAELSELAELVARLGQADGVEEIAGLLAGQAHRVVPNDRCTLLVLDEAAGPGATWQLYPGGSRGSVGNLPGPLALALSTGRPVVPPDAPAPGEEGAEAFAPGARSVLVLPLACGGPPLGTLNFSATRPGLYPPAPSVDRTLLQLNVAAVVRNARTVARLQELNERTSRLVASVTHDYRSPLGVIVGLTDLLLATEPEAPNRRQLLELIQKEALRLNEMVEAMLDLSRLSAGGQPLDRAPLDLWALVEECVATRRAAGGREPAPRHTFRVVRQEGLLPVWGDRGRLTQLLVNLLDNAVKYSPSGGQVTVTVEATDEGQGVQVAVADTGLGIAPEALATIFQPFARGAQARQAGIPGSGLGLSIGQEIAQAHGGRLWAESPGPGHGATFFLALPRRRDDETEAPRT
jgi:signal transduction histidine kinase